MSKEPMGRNERNGGSREAAACKAVADEAAANLVASSEGVEALGVSESSGVSQHTLHDKKVHLEERMEAHPLASKPRLTRGDIVKFGGLLVFFALMIGIVAALWPYFGELFEPGGLERVIADVQQAGPLGVLILLLLQFLQIIVAFIPGEVTQIAAGMLYGPWLGTLVILLGCVVSSAFIFVLVRRLGAPFVQAMVPTKYLEKFRSFEESGKLSIVVFILFLIPGLPKDTFTYLVPLTDMRMRTFLTLTTIGRIPGVFISTYAADGLMEGRLLESAVLFVIAAAIGIAGILLKDRIIGFMDRFHDAGKRDGNGK